MSLRLNKNQIERFSRQIILKNIGTLGQKKIIQSKVLIVGMGGLGCTVAEFLTRAGVGSLGIVDYDIVDLSNIHRQSLFDIKDLKKTKVICHNTKVNEDNLNKIIKNYDYVVDGTDNFKSKFLINDFCLKLKKILVTGAVNKFDGHIFTFNFKDKKAPCLRCFFQEETISDDILNCEYQGILGTTVGIIGVLQANEVLKNILNIGKNLNGFILILDLLNLHFRKVKFNKRKTCLCKRN